MENEEGEVVGFSALKYGAEGGLLDNLHVRKEFQGRGYGTLLIRYCAKQLLDSGISRMYICVVTGNIRAETRYVSLGAEFECDFTDHFEFESALSKRFIFKNLEELAEG